MKKITPTRAVWYATILGVLSCLCFQPAKAAPRIKVIKVDVWVKPLYSQGGAASVCKKLADSARWTGTWKSPKSWKKKRSMCQCQVKAEKWVGRKNTSKFLKKREKMVKRKVITSHLKNRAAAQKRCPQVCKAKWTGHWSHVYLHSLSNKVYYVCNLRWN